VLCFFFLFTFASLRLCVEFSETGLNTTRVPASLVTSSFSYSLQLAGRVSVGEIASYFSRYEPYVSATTLEIALPVKASQRLQEVDFGSGDRLVMFTGLPQQVDLPRRLNPGDKILRFRRGDFEITSHGKKGVLLGRGDMHRQPDIDLRHFIEPGLMEFIAPDCVWLQFDDTARSWFISRPGYTRVLIDEYELSATPLPLEGRRKVRFFPPAGTRDFPADRMIGELTLVVEDIRGDESEPSLESGGYRLRVMIGTERDSQTLRASYNLIMGQMITSLAAYYGAPLGADTRLYRLRPVQPGSQIQALNIAPDEMFLYATRQLYFAHNLLILRDVYQRERIYALPVGQEDDEKFIGCRLKPDAPDSTLDVDLYDTILPQLNNAAQLQSIPRYQGRIFYRAAENTWWFRLDDQAQMPVYINNLRVTFTTAARLMSGDVLSFVYGAGSTVRLEIEITSRSD
jgi:hypothetical protein